MAQVKFKLNKSEQMRNKLVRDQQLLIKKLYTEMYDDASKQLRKMGKSSDIIQRTRLQMIQRDIKTNIVRINAEIEGNLTTSITDMSRVVVEDTRKFLKECGFVDVEGAFSYVPDNITRRIVLGEVYEKGWSLSSAIWGHTNNFNEKLSYIIAQDSISGKSALEIAEDLEKYVNPDVRKHSRKIQFQQYKRDANGKFVLDENGNRIPTGRKHTFYFGDVDYNAQRLARTLISHAYQQAFETVNKNDPFVTEYVWHSSGQHGRTCSLCLDRDGKHFKKDELPLDHPNGMCMFEAYIPYTMTEISDRLAAWVNSPAGTDPALDRYAAEF